MEPSLHDKDIQSISADISLQLSDLSGKILSVSNHSEPSFLELGDRLNRGYSSVSEFTQKTIDAISSSGASSENNVFNKVESIVRSALDHIRSSHSVLTSRTEHINIVTSFLKELTTKRGRVETLVKHLNAIGFNMLIESARSERASVEFNIIAKDIRSLSETISSVIESIRSSSEDAHDRFSSAWSDITDGIGKLHQYTEEAEESVANSIQKTGQIISHSVDTVELAGERSREITRQVETIVIGLQFHDSMRQRLEHIASALSDSESDSADTETLGRLYTVASLQSAQLDDIILEINQVWKKNSDALKGILTETGTIANSLSTALTGADTSGGVLLAHEDPFTVLTITLMNIQNLQDQVIQLLSNVQETFSNASDTAMYLSDHASKIHEISREADIRALNALIAAERLGVEGKTMAVLAQEMKNISSQSDIFVTDIEQSISKITETVQRLTDQQTEESTETPSCDVSSETLSSKSSMDDIITAIFTTYEAMRREADSLTQIAGSIQDDLSEAESFLNFFDIMENDLRHCHDHLKSICDELSSWAPDESEKTIHDLQTQYTMEKEREIHKKSISGAADLFDDTSEVPSETDTDDSDDNDLGDNIELF